MPSERVILFTKEHLQHQDTEYIIHQYFNLLNEWNGKVNSAEGLAKAFEYLEQHGNGVNEFLAQVDLLKEEHDDPNPIRLGWWLVKDYLQEALRARHSKRRL